MDSELIDIAAYCNSILVKYGENVSHCKAVYIKSDNVIEFLIRYRLDKKPNYHTFQYVIENFNFIITDTDVKVNKATIDAINIEIETRLNKEYVNI